MMIKILPEWMLESLWNAMILLESELNSQSNLKTLSFW
jgi:hypothetical protein